MSAPILPGQAAGIPLQWLTVNPAHAVQACSAIVTFAEPVSNFVVKRVVDAVRSDALGMGLLKEDQINSVLIQVAPAGAAARGKPTQVGTNFQKLQGANIAQTLAVTTEAIRFDTFTYTRWVAFREQLETFLTKAMPVVSQAALVASIALEYTDFFYARDAGSSDAQQIIDRQSDFISKKAFTRRSPFHSHTGWFEHETDSTRSLVNVDITVNDASGPPGVRRAITIRTHEAEQMIIQNSPRAMELANTDAILRGLDSVHLSLKKRLRAVLTRDAANMISLGS